MGREDVAVVHHPEDSRYELLLNGAQAGELTYRDRGGDVVAFLDVDVESSLEGRGLGSKLVAAALDDARERGLRVVPRCAFVTAFVRRHPEYADLLVGDPARRD